MKNYSVLQYTTEAHLARRIVAKMQAHNRLVAVTMTSFRQCRAFHSSVSVMSKRDKYFKGLKRKSDHIASQLRKPAPEKVDPLLGRDRVSFLERVRARLSEGFGVNLIGGIESSDAQRLLLGAEVAAIKERNEPKLTEAIKVTSAEKREALHRIVSLQNAGQAEFKKLAVKLAVEEFGRFEGDTGSSEVQAAVATIYIQYLTAHCKENKNDFSALRTLQMKAQARQSILKYLKRTDPERYFWCAEKLGLTDEAITQEFQLSRKYFDSVKFFGERTLKAKLTKKERSNIIKEEKMRKAVATAQQ